MDEITNNLEQPAQPEGQQPPNPADIRKSTTKGILAAVQAATGQQFNSVEEMIAWSARALQSMAVAPQAQAPQPQVQPAKENGMAAIQAQLAAMQEAMSRKDQQLRERETESQIMGSLG